MTFFWHRHWANSRASVSPTQLLMNQNTLLRKYGDLATNPDVSFRDMALEVTKDPSMLRFLNGESNVKGAPERELRPRVRGALHARRESRRHGREELQRERRRAARQVVHRLVHRRHQPGQRQGAVRFRSLVQRAEVDLRQARQLQHRQRRRPRARPTTPRAVPRQEALGRVHAHAAAARDAAEALDRLHRFGPQDQAARARRSSPTRSCSSRSTSRT